MKTITCQEAENLFNAKGFKIIGEYLSANEPVEVMGLSCGHITSKRLGQNKRVKGCSICANQRKGKYRKFSQQDASDKFEKYGYKLLAEYVCSIKPVRVMCLGCGHITSKRLGDIGKGQCCSICAKAKRSQDKKLSQKEASDKFMSYGFKLIGEYVSEDEPVEVMGLECGT